MHDESRCWQETYGQIVAVRERTHPGQYHGGCRLLLGEYVYLDSYDEFGALGNDSIMRTK